FFFFFGGLPPGGGGATTKHLGLLYILFEFSYFVGKIKTKDSNDDCFFQMSMYLFENCDKFTSTITQ
ncbi:MAG: hypothetical protein ACK54M_02295, partial [Pseudanabaena sp.]